MGKKLVGSAQARRKEGVLQHGSLPLTGDLTRILQVLAYPDEATRAAAGARLLERATTVEAVLGRAIAWEQAAQAMISAFQSTLDLQLVRSTPTAQETARATQLAAGKYSQADWTEKSKN
jgi:lipoate-protein ligase A